MININPTNIKIEYTCPVTNELVKDDVNILTVAGWCADRGDDNGWNSYPPDHYIELYCPSCKKDHKVSW